MADAQRKRRGGRRVSVSGLLAGRGGGGDGGEGEQDGTRHGEGVETLRTRGTDVF